MITLSFQIVKFAEKLCENEWCFLQINVCAFCDVAYWVKRVQPPVYMIFWSLDMTIIWFLGVITIDYSLFLLYENCV